MAERNLLSMIPQRVRYGGYAAFTLAAALASACGGNDAEGKGGVSVNTVVPNAPEATATMVAPTATFAAPTVTPRPTETAVAKPTIPAQAQTFMTEIRSIPSISAAGADLIQSDFESDWAKALDSGSARIDRQKWIAYINVYSHLRAEYNRTKEPNIKREMDQIEKYLSTAWPDFYETSLRDPGAWLR